VRRTRYAVAFRFTFRDQPVPNHALIPPNAQRLYDPSRWNSLVRSFRLTAYSLNTLPTEPLLHLALYAGLAALKLPTCFDPSTKNVDCPVCDSDAKDSSAHRGLGKLAEDVPQSHHANSTIVCRVTGKVMDEDNMPMVLPNGQVYSREVRSTPSRMGAGRY
jgi:macrophage erythroblast attacher